MYYDHQEFGGHYYRPMSAWSLVNGALGLSINDGRYEFLPRIPGDSVRLFFAFGDGTAHYGRSVLARSEAHAIEVHTGTLRARQVAFPLTRTAASKETLKLARHTVPKKRYTVEFDGARLVLSFRRPLGVRSGQTLRVSVR